ncbi:MAG: hypothetical protein ACRDPH_08465 [Marmoricola sp.]
MTVERVVPADPWVGCVVGVETGVFEVLTDRGTVRASLAGRMLAVVARDRSRLPEAGDWVVLQRWCDGCITVAATCGPRSGGARVLPLRRR